MVGALLSRSTIAAPAACAAPRGRVYVRVGPPAPIVETRIVAPGPGYVWVPGYHAWNGWRLRLDARTWDRAAARALRRWVPGALGARRDGAGWYFVERDTGGESIQID